MKKKQYHFVMKVAPHFLECLEEEDTIYYEWFSDTYEKFIEEISTGFPTIDFIGWMLSTDYRRLIDGSVSGETTEFAYKGEQMLGFNLEWKYE